jgi:hypothetical protein
MRSIKYALKSIQEDSDIPVGNGLEQALAMRAQQASTVPLLAQGQKLTQDLNSMPAKVPQLPVNPSTQVPVNPAIQAPVPQIKPLLTQPQKLNQDMALANKIPVVPISQSQKLSQELGSTPAPTKAGDFIQSTKDNINNAGRYINTQANQFLNNPTVRNAWQNTKNYANQVGNNVLQTGATVKRSIGSWMNNTMI